MISALPPSICSRTRGADSDGTVEHDGETLIFAGDLGGLGHHARDLGEHVGALVTEGHVDLGLIELIEALSRVVSMEPVKRRNRRHLEPLVGDVAPRFGPVYDGLPSRQRSGITDPRGGKASASVP